MILSYNITSVACLWPLRLELEANVLNRLFDLPPTHCLLTLKILCSVMIMFGKDLSILL